jgi:hypothetical protein
LFSLGNYLKITEVSKVFGLFYSMDKFQYCKLWQKMGWAAYVGRFFHKPLRSPWSYDLFCFIEPTIGNWISFQ